MQPIRSNSEVGEAVSLAKADGSGYCSNFFPTPRNLQRWITHGEIFCDQRDGAALFLRKDRDVWHLYFCAASPTSLQQALTAFPEAAGFRLYNRLFRMALIVSPTTPPAAAPDPRVVLAGQTDAQSILDLLLRSFDRRVEQIPMLYEIEAAVESSQIWVARSEGALTGLLFFETQGLTSTLRYWLIAPEFRAQRFGSGLMRRYFAEHPAVRRFLLWVIANNNDAIAKYEHYGFAPDGLVDQVLANEMIRP
ncbi:MAG: GNAT family N-acetyltransferase [Verrucomicrobia bacterium]|nr:GNAT family N-acetyltransferase [Verrucomicrobiota bacterium]